MKRREKNYKATLSTPPASTTEYKSLAIIPSFIDINHSFLTVTTTMKFWTIALLTPLASTEMVRRKVRLQDPVFDSTSSELPISSLLLSSPSFTCCGTG